MLLSRVYEGKKTISGGGVVKRKILLHREALETELLKQMMGKMSKEELLGANFREAMLVSKYVRVNETKISITDGIDYVRQLCPDAVMDVHIPSLIVLPRSHNSMGQDDYVQRGYLVIQDKASCFPSQILFDEWEGGQIIDACAAPGNKTSHLASMVLKSQTSLDCSRDKRGRVLSLPCILAMDKSKNRAQVLQDRLNQCGLGHAVKVQNLDFLSLDSDASEYSKITSILLDPSCSGSGVVSIERLSSSRTGDEVEGIDRTRHAEAQSSDRISKLRGFQLAALLKAASFPSCTLIVYSTCSVNEEENEGVVSDALRVMSEQSWELIPPRNFSTWKRRGHIVCGLSGDQASCLIRCLPEDGTNGFFVALFKRNGRVYEGIENAALHTTVMVDRNHRDGTSLHELTTNKKRCPVRDVLDVDERQQHSRSKQPRSGVCADSVAIGMNGLVSAIQQPQSLVSTKSGMPGGVFGLKRFHVSRSKTKKYFKNKRK
jgi:putative methyltransferase